MKEIKHYVCEICHTEYNEKQKAIDCERKHCKPLEILGAKYLSLAQNMKGYPTSISVKMADGTIQTYKRG